MNSLFEFVMFVNTSLQIVSVIHGLIGLGVVLVEVVLILAIILYYIPALGLSAQQ